MKIDIDRLSEAALIDLNNRTVERLQFLQSARAHAEMMEFRIGERVSFEPGGRGRLIGTLVKRKTVTVITSDGQKWNVSPHFLSPAEQTGPGKGQGNVIELKPKWRGRDLSTRDVERGVGVTVNVNSAEPNIPLQPTGLSGKHFAKIKSKMLTTEPRS